MGSWFIWWRNRSDCPVLATSYGTEGQREGIEVPGGKFHYLSTICKRMGVFTQPYAVLSFSIPAERLPESPSDPSYPRFCTVYK